MHTNQSQTNRLFIILFITALHTRYQATKSSCHFSSKSRFSYTLFYFTVFCHQSHFPLIPAHNHQKLHLALHASSQHRSFVSLLRHQHFISFHNNPPIPPPVWLQILILTEKLHFTWRSHPTKNLFYLDPHVATKLFKFIFSRHKSFHFRPSHYQIFISLQLLIPSQLHVTSDPHTTTASFHFRSSHHQS